jgi:hypothetical protein
VAVVLADGQGLDMAASRRLQLTAETAGAIALLARLPAERRQLSAAATRWLVKPMVTSDTQPCWQLQRIRCKPAAGAWRLEADPFAPTKPRASTQYPGPADGAGPGHWMVQWHDTTNTLAVPADLVDRPNPPWHAGSRASPSFGVRSWAGQRRTA